MQSPQAIIRRLLDESHTGSRHEVQFVAGADHQPVGLAGSGNERLLRQHDRQSGCARRGRLEHWFHMQLAGKLGEERDADRRMLDQRLRDRRTTELLGDQHEVDVRESHPASRLRREQSRQPELAVTLPARGAAGVATLRHGAQYRGRADIGQQLARRGRHHPLLVAEGEIHARPSAPRQLHQPLRDDVALDLVRAGVDRAREREHVALEPGADVPGVGRLR